MFSCTTVVKTRVPNASTHTSLLHAYDTGASLLARPKASTINRIRGLPSKRKVFGSVLRAYRTDTRLCLIVDLHQSRVNTAVQHYCTTVVVPGSASVNDNRYQVPGNSLPISH